MRALFQRWRDVEEARSSAIYSKVPRDIDAPWPDDLAQEFQADAYRHDVGQRWCALKALWLPAIVKHVRRDGVKILERGRGDEWTLFGALCATIGITLDLRWTDAHDRAWRRRHRRASVWALNLDLAFWDSRSDGCGWSAGTLHLRPGCRVEISWDGESFL